MIFGATNCLNVLATWVTHGPEVLLPLAGAIRFAWLCGDSLGRALFGE